MGGRPDHGMGKRIALDIARGMAFLHTHRIVHMVCNQCSVHGWLYLATLLCCGSPQRHY